MYIVNNIQVLFVIHVLYVNVMALIYMYSGRSRIFVWAQQKKGGGIIAFCYGEVEHKLNYKFKDYNLNE